MDSITEQNLPSIQAYLVTDEKPKVHIVYLRDGAGRNNSNKVELSGDIP